MPPPAQLDSCGGSPAHPPATPPYHLIDWKAVAYEMTPKSFQKYQKITIPVSLLQRTFVVSTMFERLYSHFQSFCLTKASEATLRDFWERGWMIHEGFIPGLVRPGVVTNERFGFAHEHQWHEWNITSAKVMRYYWADMLQGLPAYVHHRVRTICSEILATLPGPHGHCARCDWNMPSYEMWNEVCCTYCHDRERYPWSKFTMIQGVPAINTNESGAVQEEGQLIRNFHDMCV